MARVNNLSNFLTDVASAIKTKKGSETAIPAADFDMPLVTQHHRFDRYPQAARCKKTDHSRDPWKFHHQIPDILSPVQPDLPQSDL